MQHDEWSVPGAPVTGYVWKAARPRGAVLVLHGFGEYAHRYLERHHALIPTLLAGGFTVYSYDQRGHGHSAGRRAVVDAEYLVQDHLRAREALREREPNLFVFGHSMGGLITAASAARDPRGLGGVVLSSPALLLGVDEPAWRRRIAPYLARLAPAAPITELTPGGLSRLADENEAHQNDAIMYKGRVPALTGVSMLRLSEELWDRYARWTLPTLIFHGTADTVTDPEGSRRFHGAIPATDKTHIEYDGGYHELLNDEPREEVRGMLVGWLRERAGTAAAREG